ncbi:hypothetical protein [Rhizorhabdus sp. FW153]|uniref:hypothetical protein n=1 Tax=Rhizorhabdus sp. FW153 TaxID=3400216 RepID=UPI003CEC3EA8
MAQALGADFDASLFVSNEGSLIDESLPGDLEVWATVAEAAIYFEHWCAEVPEMRFYTARGEKVIAVDHGDLTFHFEPTGEIYEDFDLLMQRGAARSGLGDAAAGMSGEAIAELLLREKEEFWKQYELNKGPLRKLFDRVIRKVFG